MAALTMRWYGRGLEAFKNGDIDWVADTIKVILVEAGYAPNQGTHQFLSDVTNQSSGDGYTSGGEELTAKTENYESADRRIVLDANDLSWDPSTITARYCVIYKDTGTAGTSPLIAYGDAGSAQASDDTPFIIEWDPAGILRVSAV